MYFNIKNIYLSSITRYRKEVFDIYINTCYNNLEIRKKKEVEKTIKENINQNLKDAGCSHQLIEEIIELYDTGKKEKIKEILSVHRKKILDNDIRHKNK